MNASQVVAGVPIDESTIAAFLRDLATADQPRIVFADTCAKHKLSIDAGRTLANRYGYPDQRRLARAAEEAANRARFAERADVPKERPADRHVGESVHGIVPAGLEGAATGERLLELPLARIKADPKNIRTELTEIRELADSIEELGLLQHVVVRPSDEPGDDQLILVIGHRRRAAYELLGRDTIPAVVRGHMLPDEVLAAMLVENGQRVGLDPIEEARGLNQLKARGGLVDKDLARRVGRSQSYVSGRLSLLSLSVDDQAAVKAGTLSLQTAIGRARQSNGTWRPNAQGKASAAHLSFDHPLASSAEVTCRQNGHSKMTAGRVGGVACGSCWETVIRSDESMRMRRRRGADTDFRDAVRALADDWKNAGRDDVAGDLDNLLGDPA